MDVTKAFENSDNIMIHGGKNEDISKIQVLDPVELKKILKNLQGLKTTNSTKKKP